MVTWFYGRNWNSGIKKPAPAPRHSKRWNMYKSRGDRSVIKVKSRIWEIGKVCLNSRMIELATGASDRVASCNRKGNVQLEEVLHRGKEKLI